MNYFNIANHSVGESSWWFWWWWIISR